MKPEKWQKIAEQFHALVEMHPKDREVALETLKRQDPDRYDAVLALLQEEQHLHPILQTGAPQSWNRSESHSLPGTQIGAYHIIEQIGEGGMGVVYRVERTAEDFEQELALKLIRPGMFKGESVRRFRQERQILAKLTHPGIARLYDGGRTPDGQLFFTMELVEGKDLIHFLSQQETGIRERIHHFKKVAEAIAYAHSRLVLHLDLKPANILVNAEEEIKVLDFGVAEYLDQETGQSSQPLPYTLAYAAPEQIRRENTTTQSDIYALGGLLYQILTDKLPFVDEDPTRLKEKVLHQTALPPSQHHSHIDADLDRIALHCLEKAPQNRYNSVQQLIDDLQAWLDKRPISLRKGESAYTAKQFVRRNQLVLSVVSLAIFGLIGLATFYTLALQEEKNEALKEAEKNRYLVSFVTDVFSTASPESWQGDTLNVFDLLSQAGQRTDSLLADQPDMYVEMMILLGNIYNEIGEDSLANQLTQKGLALCEQHASLSLHPNHTELLILAGNILTNRGRYEAAQKMYEKGLSISQHDLGKKESPCYFLHPLGVIASYQGDFDRADSLFQLLQDCLNQYPDTPPEEWADLYDLLGFNHVDKTQFDSSAYYFRRSIAVKSTLYEAPHPELAYTTNWLANMFLRQQGFDSALVHARIGYEQRNRLFGQGNIETVASMNHMSRAFRGQEEMDSALFWAIRAQTGLSEVYPTPTPNTMISLSYLGRCYLQDQQFRKADSCLNQAIALRQEFDPEGKLPRFSRVRIQLNFAKGKIASVQTNYQQAIPFLQEGLAEAEAVGGFAEEELEEARRILAVCQEKVAS
ncbi:MAG: protein kinase [Bacteroidota bacterium]